jgi:hypothetical protein
MARHLTSSSYYKKISVGDDHLGQWVKTLPAFLAAQFGGPQSPG